MHYTYFALSLFTIISMATSQASNFFGNSEPLPLHIQQLMIGRSWKPECPVPLQDLRYLTIAHWGFDDQVHVGHMVVHKNIANELLEIFAELFENSFPIERMKIIDQYDADDERSMEDDNSSAFCFRANTTLPGVYSLHSYGVAIDINPRINPYIRGTILLPKNATDYLDRTMTHKGIITESEDNVCYQAFTKRGYAWGGNSLPGRVDYQHFAKTIQATT